MMYMVSFVLRHGTDADYPGLREEFDKLGPWSDRLKPTWLLECGMSSAQVRDALKAHIKPTDRIFVAEISRNWAAGSMGEGFGEWMQRRMTMRRAHGVPDQGPVPGAVEAANAPPMMPRTSRKKAAGGKGRG